MLEVNIAQDIVLKHKLDYTTQPILTTKSIGRKLKRDIFSLINIPSYPTSTRDGYCWRTDWRDKTQFLSVDNVFATAQTINSKNEKTVLNYTKYIATGGIILDDYDSVVMVEDTFKSTDYGVSYGNFVTLNDNVVVVKNQYIRQVGSDIQKGEQIAKKGDIIDAYLLGLLVSCGIQYVQVERTDPFKIGILSTGNEVVDINTRTTLQPGELFDINRYVLIEKCKQFNLNVVDLGIQRDDPEYIKNTIKNSMCDIIITSGGTSVGQKDFIPEVITSLGGELLITKINMMPGKPFLFSILKDLAFQPVIFGLAGNPVSSVAGWELFIVPFIKASLGVLCTNTQRKLIVANSDIVNKDKFRPHYIRVKVTKGENSCLLIDPTDNQVSSNVKGLIGVNALVKVTPSTTISKGETINISDVHFLTEDDREYTNNETSTIRNAKIGIIVASDRASAGIYEDKSGKAIEEYLSSTFVGVGEIVKIVIPDDEMCIQSNLMELIQLGCTFIITTGGSGPSKRDVTSVITSRFIDKELLGFGEQMREQSLKVVPTAILSGQTAGIKYNSKGQGCFIINLPGSPNSIKECLDVVKNAIPYCIELASEDYIDTNPPSHRGKDSIYKKK
jgi:molybdenum cofactor synthesis domain-containing protein